MIIVMRMSGTVEIVEIEGEGGDDTAKWLDERKKALTFKNCAQFIECISEINNTQIDNAKDIDANCDANV